MFGLILFVILFFFAFNVFLFILSIFSSRRIMKKFPSLHIIGYKNGVIYLGVPSDSKVNPMGLVPVCKAYCFDYDKLVRPTVITSYKLKARFSLNDGIPYKLTIIDQIL